jgi:membrane-associated phospholipid phosphatase
MLLLVGTPPLYAQSEEASSPPDSSAQPGPWVPPPGELWQDAVDIATGPFTLSPTERWWVLGSVGFVVGTAAVIDVPAYRHISTRSRNDGANTGRRATSSFSLPGRWYDQTHANRLALGTVGGLAVSGLVLRNRALTRTSVQTLEAIVFTDLINGLVKSVLNRDRPYVGAEPEPFAYDPGAFSGEHTKLAMPSGHAARVFAIASVLSEQAERWYVSVPLYAGAASVGVERVRSGDHWLTDVLVGAAIGILVGRSVTSGPVPGTESDSGTASASIRYAPILSMRRVGVAVRF